MKNKWISLLLSLLGFAAAGCEETRVEYGSPYATYTLKGKVTDMNGKAISGIRVDAAGRSYTDEEGTFSCTGDGMYGIPHTIEVHLQDVDGTDNGACSPTNTSPLRSKRRTGWKGPVRGGMKEYTKLPVST